MYKHYTTKAGAKAAIKKAGLGAMETEYVTYCSRLTNGKTHYMPIVSCELSIDVEYIINEKGFMAKMKRVMYI